MTLTKEQLLFDLYVAFECAKKNKSNKPYVVAFEKDLHKNLIELCEKLYTRKYEPHGSICFIINNPKKREVFAANFVDRIIHHLFYNYTHTIFERTFIYDTYSCIKNRGTHFGIKRMKHHILSVSDNYHKPAYVLKMDIRGYFMHIDRNILLKTSEDTLNKFRHRTVSKQDKRYFNDILDFDFLLYLNRSIVLLDPTSNCSFHSPICEWDGLPPSKSLFKTTKGTGLPIGNLTSQLYSNVYLNKLDQYIKRVLKCKHYGRYVDDFYIIHTDRKYLLSIVPKIEHFLKNKLRLNINRGKTKIISVRHGVEFLGAFIKPFRTYISTGALKRIRNKICSKRILLDNICPEHRINSYLGVLSHYKTYNIRVELFYNIKEIYKFGGFNNGLTKFIVRKQNKCTLF